VRRSDKKGRSLALAQSSEKREKGGSPKKDLFEKSEKEPLTKPALLGEECDQRRKVESATSSQRKNGLLIHHEDVTIYPAEKERKETFPWCWEKRKKGRPL